MRHALLVFVSLLFVAICSVCTYLAVYLWQKIAPGGPVETYAPVIQAVLTPVTSLITVLFSYLLIDRQFRFNKEIEKIKLDLGERYKRESDAYLQLWKAVASSYRTVSNIETRKLDSEENTLLAKILSEAEPYSFVLSHDDEEQFYDYFQKIDNLRASASKAPGNKERSDIWKANAKIIGDLHSAIRDRYKTAYLGSDLTAARK